MRKAALKRIRITKTGKLLHRRPGQNHFNAKMSRGSQLRKKGMSGFAPSVDKKMRGYMNQN